MHWILHVFLQNSKTVITLIRGTLAERFRYHLRDPVFQSFKNLIKLRKLSHGFAMVPLTGTALSQFNEILKEKKPDALFSDEFF